MLHKSSICNLQKTLAWEIALNEVFTEQQQCLIFDKLKQGSEPGHLKVAETWSSLHRASLHEPLYQIGLPHHSSRFA